MFLNQLVRHGVTRGLPLRSNARTASTVIGSSGRAYVRGEVLQHHHMDHTLSIFKARSGDESFVLKRVHKRVYDLSLRFAADFAGSRRLRVHTDCNPEEGVLVYPFFTSTLLALIEDDPGFPVVERGKILRRVGEAIRELHGRDWIHLDVKPDNILVNWACDAEGNKVVTDAALGDFDIALNMEGGVYCQTPYPVGNVMWRSPEGQTGRGMARASDVYSFGLVWLYTLGRGDGLILNDEDFQKAAEEGTPAKAEILARHFSYFGPVPEGLLSHVDDADWYDFLKQVSETAGRAVEERPGLRLERWGLGSETRKVISAMTNLDPAARPSIDEVLATMV